VAYIKARLFHNASAHVDPAFAQRVGLFAILPPTSGRAIVMLGDSITYMCEWRELLGNQALVLNRGIGGDTSAGVLKRAAGVGALKPVAVFLMIGANDPQSLGYSPEDTAKNYRDILRTVLQASPDTKIYLQSILPSRSPKFNTWSEKANRHIHELADATRVTYVDLRPAFLDKDGLLDHRLTLDGLHLSAEGYVVWKRQIQPIIDELVNADRRLRGRDLPGGGNPYPTGNKR
jgi:lysophospholipase L1-like esterase